MLSDSPELSKRRRWPGRREIARGADIDAGEVADRIVVFGIAQAPGEHNAGRPAFRSAMRFPLGANPGDDSLPLARCGLTAGVVGRHFAGLEALANGFPDWRCFGDIRE